MFWMFSYHLIAVATIRTTTITDSIVGGYADENQLQLGYQNSSSPSCYYYIVVLVLLFPN